MILIKTLTINKSEIIYSICRFNTLILPCMRRITFLHVSFTCKLWIISIQTNALVWYHRDLPKASQWLRPLLECGAVPMPTGHCEQSKLSVWCVYRQMGQEQRQLFPMWPDQCGAGEILHIYKWPSSSDIQPRMDYQASCPEAFCGKSKNESQYYLDLSSTLHGAFSF